MKRNYEKLKAWKERSRKPLKKTKLQASSTRRRSENLTYGKLRQKFLSEHPVCIVTGQPSTQIHHIAKRYGEWLNLRYYWVGVSMEGHQIIEDHKDWATSRGLIYRANHGYKDEMIMIKFYGHNPDEPFIYVDKANLRAIMEDVKVKAYLNPNL